ncbi:MAG: acyl-CoA dehydrogenase family protein [Proteobacteria bacterium]|nr:acyl-CoA dehydrogenase family protein [Pseudomonadota bacterium]
MFTKRTIYTPEHEAFRESFRKFVQEQVVPHREQWEQAGIVPRSVWKACGDLGFLVPAADEQFGGLGIKDFRYEAVMLEELSYFDEFGLLLGLHTTIVAPYLLNYGNAEQKARIIPRIVSGETILAVAMTEPGAGSDLAGMRTVAEDKGDYWLLNGQKTFISNGLNSDLVLVAAKTVANNPHAMGLFIVERGDEGFHRGKALKKIGLLSQDTAELFFENVKVRKVNVLGDPTKGFKYLMAQLATERLSVAIGAVASCRAALDHTIRYVKERNVFGKPLASFQNSQFKLAEMATETDIAQIYVDRLITAQVDGQLSVEQACGAKYWTSDLACKIIDECLQLHGGYGYMTEYPISKMFVNARVGRIYAGANEIMKTVIARSLQL